MNTLGFETIMDRLAALEIDNRLLRETVLASEIALAASQAETKIGVADLLASVTDLATSRAETKTGVADLLATVADLATSRAETRIGVADLLASATALATSRAETKTGVADLLASETAIGGLETLARELGQARDAAVLANLAKSRFLAGMSHELRTPLHGVLGYAELLQRDGGLNEVQSARVTAMLGAGRHLLEMIEGVLDLSEIEAGRAELHVAEVNVRRVARACLDLVRPTAEAKQLVLGLAITPAVPAYLTTDTKRLRQVLFNLLGNAVKYTLRGAVDLRIQVTRDGASLRFEVADTGPGIPPQHHDRLFEEFRRLDAGSLSTVEGAGLGLSLSKQLATLMGGRVGHNDNVGGGSIFWLELPLRCSDMAEPNPALQCDAGLTSPARSLLVLVVDDVLMNRDIAGSFLRARGHRVMCASSGAEAVGVAATTDFDVVLMDVRMPEMDGLEATRRIRAIAGSRGRVPIVALTAQVFTDQVAECRRAGMDTHLAKPFDPDTLLAVVVQAVKARPGKGPDCPPEATVVQGSARPVLGAELPVLNPNVFARTASFLKPEAIACYLRTVASLGETLMLGLRTVNASASDDAALAETAHKLAGSAGMIGLERVASLACRFEHAVATDAADLSDLAAGLCAAIEATGAEIHSHALQSAAGRSAPSIVRFDIL